MFNGKKRQQEREEWEKDKKDTSELYNKCKKFCPIGKRFKYLGQVFVCKGHFTFNPYQSVTAFGIFGRTFIPAVVSEFKDKHGIIREKIFYGRDLPALIAENKKRKSK